MIIILVRDAVKEIDERKKIGRGLSVHHIDYNKENDQDDNLITVCLSCNTTVNYDREFWQEFFTRRIKNAVLPS